MQQHDSSNLISDYPIVAHHLSPNAQIVQNPDFESALVEIHKECCKEAVELILMIPQTLFRHKTMVKE